MYRYQARIENLPRNKVSLTAKLIVACVVQLFAPQPAHSATFQGIGDLPGGSFESYAEAISGDGKVAVGESRDSAGYQPVRWDAESGIATLGAAINGFHNALAVSADGSVVGGRRNGAYVWTEESGFTNLGNLPGGASNGANVAAVSADGSVAAGIGNRGGGPEAYRWTTETGMVGLGNDLHSGLSFAWDISGDGSVVIGYACDPCEAFHWTEETGMVGLGEFDKAEIRDSRAYGVSGDGAVVVGRAFDADDVLQAFRWTEEEGMQGLGFVPGGRTHDSVAFGASSDGSVIVGAIGNDFAGNYSGPFIWTADAGMQRLNLVLAEEFGLGPELAGWTLSTAVDVSADGLTIVGNGRNPQGQQEGWIARLDPPNLAGDFNGNGAIEQADLDLVLLNWGVTSASPPVGWINDLPTGAIDQDDLDKVLLGWGNTAGAAFVAGVPEPAAFEIAALLAGCLYYWRHSLTN